MSLKDLQCKLGKIHKRSDEWDVYIIQAGEKGGGDIAAQAMSAARRDKWRSAFYWNFEDRTPLIFDDAAEALDFYGDAMKQAAADIRAEKPGGDVITKDKATKWILAEILDGLQALLYRGLD